MFFLSCWPAPLSGQNLWATAGLGAGTVARYSWRDNPALWVGLVVGLIVSGLLDWGLQLQDCHVIVLWIGAMAIEVTAFWTRGRAPAPWDWVEKGSPQPFCHPHMEFGLCSLGEVEMLVLPLLSKYYIPRSEARERRSPLFLSIPTQSGTSIMLSWQGRGTRSCFFASRIIWFCCFEISFANICCHYLYLSISISIFSLCLYHLFISKCVLMSFIRVRKHW